MLRPWLVAIPLRGLAGAILYLKTLHTNYEDASGMDVGASQWPPTSAEIVKLTGANHSDPDNKQGNETRNRYQTLYKNRYRKHTPEMAAGMRFAGRDTVDVLMPARMEPWNMDRMAIQAYDETEAVFGHRFKVDLYVTYIGLKPLKVGELRPTAANPNRIFISHYKPRSLPGKPVRLLRQPIVHSLSERSQK